MKKIDKSTLERAEIVLSNGTKMVIMHNLSEFGLNIEAGLERLIGPLRALETSVAEDDLRRPEVRQFRIQPPTEVDGRLSQRPSLLMG